MDQGRIVDKLRVRGYVKRFCLLALLMVTWNRVLTAGAQSPAIVATYTIHADGAIKEPGGHEFVWKVAPDNSLIVLIAQSNGRWTIKRLIDWQTQTPKEQTSTFSDPLPSRERNSFVWFDDPLIDSEGKYILVHRRTDLKNVPPMGDPNGAALVAVLELSALSLVHKAQGLELRGDYQFTPQGSLLRFSWRVDSRFLHEVTALTFPGLDLIASCQYNETFAPPVSLAYLEREGSSCPAFLRSVHLSSLDDLSSHSVPPLSLQDLPGPNRYCAQLSRTGHEALFRCGDVHFADRAGDFFIVFWKALAILSVPEGRVLVSLPLRWNDSESSGVFAQADGTGYLIVRRGFELRTYRVP